MEPRHIVPYFFQINTNTYTGHAERYKLTTTIFEDIAENMTYAFLEKQNELCEKIKVMYFENYFWHVFDISKEKEEIMRIYNEKYSHFYIESESESESDDESESKYSEDSDTYYDSNYDSNYDDDSSIGEKWERLFEESRKKIYDCHVKLMNRDADIKCK